MGRGTLGEVWEGSERSGTGQGPLDSLGRVEGPSGRFGPDRGTLGKVWDGLGDPRGGPGRVGLPSGRSETGRGTIGEVQVGSGDYWGSL